MPLHFKCIIFIPIKIKKYSFTIIMENFFNLSFLHKEKKEVLTHTKVNAMFLLNIL